MNQYDVIVIGGGASGMMAAGVAGSRGRRVLLIEKNQALGKKLSITGGGRCNITNAEFDTRELLSHYGSAQDFLFSPFSQFGVRETIDFFESRNLPIMVEARLRAFPRSERARDVVAVMEQFVTSKHIEILTNCSVEKFIMKDNKIAGISTSRGEFTAESYILATGGASHPETGSTGDGFDFLSYIGHSVVSPTPTIVPLGVSESWISMLAGITLPNAKVTFKLAGKKIFSNRGSILFTHTGLSGPCILNSSTRVSDLLHAGTVTAVIDLFPDQNIGELEQQFLEIFDANKNKTFKNIIGEITGISSLKSWEALLVNNDISAQVLETKVHSISKIDRKKIVHLVKSITFTISELMGFDKAVVADGGVILSEIDTKSMRSRVHSNLYITGDLLHINRPTGGYSLQLCWTTGYIAGKNA